MGALSRREVQSGRGQLNNRTCARSTRRHRRASVGTTSREVRGTSPRSRTDSSAPRGWARIERPTVRPARCPSHELHPSGDDDSSGDRWRSVGRWTWCTGARRDATSGAPHESHRVRRPKRNDVSTASNSAGFPPLPSSVGFPIQKTFSGSSCSMPRLPCPSSRGGQPRKITSNWLSCVPRCLRNFDAP